MGEKHPVFHLFWMPVFSVASTFIGVTCVPIGVWFIFGTFTGHGPFCFGADSFILGRAELLCSGEVGHGLREFSLFVGEFVFINTITLVDFFTYTFRGRFKLVTDRFVILFCVMAF